MLVTLAVLGALALLLAMASSGATAKIKPKYRLKVSISGNPSTITLDREYTYTITVKNTGRLKLKKVTVWYSNGYNVTGSSLKFTRLPRPDATVPAYEIRWTLTNLRAGATKRITVQTIYKSDANGAEGFEVRAKGTPGGSAELLKQAWYEGH
jgi:archaellum component FlaG (FlaF/FlaG flagellin family)